MWSCDIAKIQITVGSVWEGRGIKIRVLRVGLAVVLIERLDISPKLQKYRIHPWAIESMEGMTRIK
jgi:hypothetical protein